MTLSLVLLELMTTDQEWLHFCQLFDLLDENGVKARQLDHTIMFLAFDLDEFGLLDSRAFVKNWLIPNFLQGKHTVFLRAYIFDVNLLYDPNPRSHSAAKNQDS